MEFEEYEWASATEIFEADGFAPVPSFDVARNAVDAFNAFIASQSQLYGAPLVDVHMLLDRLDLSGLRIGNYVLSTQFLGGIFSLDGIHPTNTGHALVANHVLRAIDQTLGGGIPTIPLLPIVENDPLAFPLSALRATAAAPDPDLARQLSWMVTR